MVDNVTINPGTGGPTVRALARQGGTIETQVTQVDIGGVSGNAEVLLQAGQQTRGSCLPAVLATEQEGTGATGVTALTGGTGFLGWFSSIYSKLAALAAVLTAGQNSASAGSQMMVSGQFNTSPTTIGTGNSSPLQMDAAGNVLVNVKAGAAGGAPGVAQGSTTSGQTGPLMQGAVLSSAPTYTTGTTQPPRLDVNGNVCVSIISGGGSGGTSSSFGAAFPGTGTAIGISDGANMRAIKRPTKYAFTGMAGGNALLTTAQQISAVAGALHKVDAMFNPNNQSVWVQIYDRSTAPTLGTTVPDLSFEVPALGWFTDDFGTWLGVNMVNGISIAVTTTQGGGTVPATGLSGNIIYQ